MKLETTTIVNDATGEIDLHELEGVLTRVETTPTDGWMLYGRPVEEWAEECVREYEAVNYLAHKVAAAEGLEGQAAGERAMDLVDEAHEWAKNAKAQAEARDKVAVQS